MTKHKLFICGLTIVVWGPENEESCYRELIKYIAKQLYLNSKATADLQFALQLSPGRPLVDHVLAYRAYSKIYAYLHRTPYSAKAEIFLKCDEIFQETSSASLPLVSTPSRSSLPVVVAPTRKQEVTALDKLTEILVNRRRSYSDTTTLKSTNGILTNVRQWLLQNIWYNFFPPPQTTVLASVMIAIFGFLLLPIR